jgi:hypothetical protein
MFGVSWRLCRFAGLEKHWVAFEEEKVPRLLSTTVHHFAQYNSWLCTTAVQQYHHRDMLRKQL